MGGDEFAMTVSGEQAVNQALAFARAVLELLKPPLSSTNENLYQRQHRHRQRRPGELFQHRAFRRADIAMYHSKNR